MYHYSFKGNAWYYHISDDHDTSQRPKFLIIEEQYYNFCSELDT